MQFPPLTAPARQAPPRPSQPPGGGVRPAVTQSVQARTYPEDGGQWWLARLPGRLLAFLGLVTVPVRTLALLLDMAVSLCVLAVVGTGWAWWTGRITDDQVAEVLGVLGERLLSILSKSGVL